MKKNKKSDSVDCRNGSCGGSVKMPHCIHIPRRAVLISRGSACVRISPKGGGSRWWDGTVPPGRVGRISVRLW